MTRIVASTLPLAWRTRSATIVPRGPRMRRSIVVEREAGRRATVDRDDRIAGAYAGADRRVAFDRVDQHRAGLRILADVDADAAEVAALEFFIERADRVRTQVRRVRIAEAAEHPADRDVGDERFAAGVRVALA